jgi:hypothetical protein
MSARPDRQFALRDPPGVPETHALQSRLVVSQDGLGPRLGQQAQHHECVRHRHQSHRIGEQRPVRRPLQRLGRQRPQPVFRVHRVIEHREESTRVSRGWPDRARCVPHRPVDAGK